MATIWMKSRVKGSYQGERCAAHSNRPPEEIGKLIDGINKELQDIGVDISIWVEE